MELADQQVSENESGGLSGAEIPVAADVPAREAPAEKPLSLREQIVKNVESVRTEEAKRARAADGKFAKLDGAAEEPATEEIPKPEANAQPTESNPVGPPSGWSKEAKAIWDQLPEAVKADAVRREAEVSKGFEEYRTKTAQLQEISQALDPIRPVLQQNGIQSDAQAVKVLLQWEDSFRNPQTRIGAFQNLAKQYGVDLSTLVPSSSGSPSAAQDNPESLRPVLDEFGNRIESVQQELQTFRNERISQELAAFAKDKPHFETVRELMGKLMSGGAAMDLESAYQQATKIHPEVSAKIEAERIAKEKADRVRENAEKVNRAAAAAVSPTTRPPAGAPVGQSATGTGVRGSILNAVKALREEQRA